MLEGTADGQNRFDGMRRRSDLPFTMTRASRLHRQCLFLLLRIYFTQNGRLLETQPASLRGSPSLLSKRPRRSGHRGSPRVETGPRPSLIP